jgi:hypothetical protein
VSEAIGQNSSFPASLKINYTLSTSAATGRFLTELGNRRIVGSRCTGCARTLVPAQEHCPRCARSCDELLQMPETGTITAFTERAGEVIALIRLDGADSDVLHRVRGVAAGELAVGLRVRAMWADNAEGSILDLAGFEPAGADSERTEPTALPTTDAEVISERPYGIDLKYEHAYGNYYGRLFSEIKETRRIMGVRCPSCQSVLVPPRPVCENCFVETAQWEDVADTGTLRAFSVIHLAFEGQVREPPFVYAELVLDGGSTRLIHVLGGFDVLEASTLLKPGQKVRAVWLPDSHTGTLADIDYFEPIFDD